MKNRVETKLTSVSDSCPRCGNWDDRSEIQLMNDRVKKNSKEKKFLAKRWIGSFRRLRSRLGPKGNIARRWGWRGGQQGLSAYATGLGRNQIKVSFDRRVLQRRRESSSEGPFSPFTRPPSPSRPRPLALALTFQVQTKVYCQISDEAILVSICEVKHPRSLPSPNLYGYPYPSEEGPDPSFFGGMTVRGFHSWKGPLISIIFPSITCLSLSQSGGITLLVGQLTQAAKALFITKFTMVERFCNIQNRKKVKETVEYHIRDIKVASPYQHLALIMISSQDSFALCPVTVVPPTRRVLGLITCMPFPNFRFYLGRTQTTEGHAPRQFQVISSGCPHSPARLGYDTEELQCHSATVVADVVIHGDAGGQTLSCPAHSTSIGIGASRSNVQSTNLPASESLYKSSFACQRVESNSPSRHILGKVKSLSSFHGWKLEKRVLSENVIIRCLGRLIGSQTAEQPRFLTEMARPSSWAPSSKMRGVPFAGHRGVPMPNSHLAGPPALKWISGVQTQPNSGACRDGTGCTYSKTHIYAILANTVNAISGPLSLSHSSYQKAQYDPGLPNKEPEHKRRARLDKGHPKHPYPARAHTPAVSLADNGTFYSSYSCKQHGTCGRIQHHSKRGERSRSPRKPSQPVTSFSFGGIASGVLSPMNEKLLLRTAVRSSHDNSQVSSLQHRFGPPLHRQADRHLFSHQSPIACVNAQSSAGTGYGLNGNAHRSVGLDDMGSMGYPGAQNVPLSVSMPPSMSYKRTPALHQVLLGHQRRENRRSRLPYCLLLTLLATRNKQTTLRYASVHEIGTEASFLPLIDCMAWRGASMGARRVIDLEFSLTRPFCLLPWPSDKLHSVQTPATRQPALDVRQDSRKGGGAVAAACKPSLPYRPKANEDKPPPVPECCPISEFPIYKLPSPVEEKSALPPSCKWTLFGLYDPRWGQRERANGREDYVRGGQSPSPVILLSLGFIFLSLTFPLPMLGQPRLAAKPSGQVSSHHAVTPMKKNSQNNTTNPRFFLPLRPNAYAQSDCKDSISRCPFAPLPSAAASDLHVWYYASALPAPQWLSSPYMIRSRPEPFDRRPFNFKHSTRPSRIAIVVIIEGARGKGSTELLQTSSSSRSFACLQLGLPIPDS
ncbi:uncharacterized protein CLUP02_03434 [Colletotrichum lupini]|uniref:Uncharacterized protein n=1 Tax=Colletotrichum lupini TaxID=145971 RepID=A0A9Q8WCC3_9PEZI|nr:uncharacterized protein CLUP02_03434 [Colletotrichum lupini]UQC77961.1 hypothetical protein CLUP02_03434 [Colletotrichum lupini]